VIKLGDVVMILDLHRQGLSVSAIARELGIDRKTVRKYIARGLEPPVYGPRQARARLIDPFVAYLRERVTAYPGLSGRRLLREIRERGYRGGYSTVTETVRDLRPPVQAGYEVRFETPPGEQAQVDFAHFEAIFSDEPGVVRKVWLFSLILGYSRLLWARFVQHQDLQSVLRCHRAAFAALGGVPRTILYDRMKTVVTGEPEPGHIVYNRHLVDFAVHHGYQPRACRPYRAKTKGKVERPYRYVRQDFFLGRTFRNLDDLNDQLIRWLDEVANPRLHATTRRVILEAFAEERAHLKTLPLAPWRTVLKLERRITRDGMISVGGNLYSVPDATRRRVVEVQCLADEILIVEDGTVVAVHPVLEGKNRRRVAPGHRRPTRLAAARPVAEEPAVVLERAGDRVGQRPLAVYDTIARGLASQNRSQPRARR
jgi:transposase